ncbi:MAG: M13 family metallopeptidase [Acholeplasmatales bacterium]|nr:M13 family metallopeptidase [Acholeplasmatales bacterium]
MKSKFIKSFNVAALLLVSVTLASCGGNNAPTTTVAPTTTTTTVAPTTTTVEPVTTTTTVEPITTTTTTSPKELTYRYYTLEDGVENLDFLEGYPWLNTSVEGVMSKIKKPSIKDDFFAYTNYEYIRNLKMPDGKNKYGGTIFEGSDLTEERVKAILTDKTSPMNQIYTYYLNGDKDNVKASINEVMGYTSAQVQDYFSSKDMFYNTAGIVELYGDRDKNITLNLSYDYLNNAAMGYYYAEFYNMLDEFVEGFSDIIEAEGFEMADTEAFINNNIEPLLGVYKELDDHTEDVETTVGQLDTVFNKLFNFKQALKELGFKDDDVIHYSTGVVAFTEAIKDYVDNNGYDVLKNCIALTKMFYYRYLIGASDYLDLYREKLSKLEYFEDDTILDKTTPEEFATNTIKDRYFEELSREYVLKHANNKSREVLSDIVAKVIAEYKQLLTENDWLSDETKAKAIEKLENMFYITYFEDELLEVDAFSTNKSNVMDLDKDYYDYTIPYYKLVRIDMMKGMAPYITNAAYFPSSNGIIITHSIVSSFMDNEDLSPEFIYGSIGCVIGHEISHGFDSNGSKYDKVGKHENWWTEEDKATFDNKIGKMDKYYDNNLFSFSSSPLSGELVNGEVTADMGGMKVMLRIAAKEQSFDYKKFFESFARFFSYIYTHEKGVDDTKNNPHPLSYLRVNLTLAQFDKFQEVYDIHEGDGMYIKPEDRIYIW